MPVSRSMRATSAIRKAPGSVAPTRTPTDCCVSTSRKAPISVRTAPRRSVPWQPPSTHGRERCWAGKRPQRRLTSGCRKSTGSVLRRPLESAQYVSLRYTQRLAEAGIEPSVGSVGDSYDNALAETIIGLFKTEVIARQGPWRGFEDVEFATLNWVWWFNHHRLLEPIGWLPPAEYEEAYWRARDERPMLPPLE